MITNLVEYENDSQWLKLVESLNLLDEFPYGARSKAIKLKQIKINMAIYVVIVVLVTFERIFTLRKSLGNLDFFKTDLGIFASTLYALFLLVIGFGFYQELQTRKEVFSEHPKLILYQKEKEYYLAHFTFHQIKLKVVKFNLSEDSEKIKLDKEQNLLSLYVVNDGKYELILRREDDHFDNFIEVLHSNLHID